MATYKLGAVLRRPVEGPGGLFACHVGIYIGDGKVIHLPGESKSNEDWISPKVVSLDRFANGDRIKIHEEPGCLAHGKAIVRMARKLSKEFKYKYHFFKNNCEDFVIECYEVDYQ